MAQKKVKITYEVQSKHDDRWLTERIYEFEKKARTRAGMLVDAANSDAIRILYCRVGLDGSTSEKVLFEEAITNRKSKPVTAQRPDTAPVWETPEAFFDLDARLTLGRVFRAWLEQRALTFSEMISSPSALGMLNRHETLQPQAVGIISTVQAETSDATQRDLAQKLNNLFEALKPFAEEMKPDAERLAATLSEDGLDRFVAARAQLPAEKRQPLTVAAIAEVTRSQADLDQKLGLLLATLPGDPGPPKETGDGDEPASKEGAPVPGQGSVAEHAKDLAENQTGENQTGANVAGRAKPPAPLPPETVAPIDEMMAEIIDDPAAVRSILGAQADLGSAIVEVVLLLTGRGRMPPTALPLYRRLFVILRIHPLPHTVAALERWLTRALEARAPLTKEGKDAELTTFQRITRALSDPGALNKAGKIDRMPGTSGGREVAIALSNRARAVLLADSIDQRFEFAIDALIVLISPKAAQIGYLINLFATPFGQREDNRRILIGTMLRLLTKLRSLADISAPGTAPDRQEQFRAAIANQLAATGVPPAEIQQVLTALKRLKPGDPKDYRRGGSAVDTSASMDAQKAKASDAPVDKPSTPAEALFPTPSDHSDLEEPSTSANGGRRHFAAGEVIFRAASLGREAYLVKTGAVDIVIKHGTKPVTVATMKPGDIFGEMALIDNEPREADAVARVDTTVSVVRESAFKKRLDTFAKNDPVLRHLIDVYVARLRAANRLLSLDK